MIARETKVVHTTDRFMKVIFTVIAVCLLWLSVKDTRLEPGVTMEARPGHYTLGSIGGGDIGIRLDCIGCN